MPSYDYKCRTCDAVVSIVASIKKDPDIPICSNCQLEMIRQFSAPPIRFNGSGFYSSGKNR